jgi:UMF1 family MFS transporter
VSESDRRQVFAWSIFDLANTIFSFNILSFYFPVWASDTLGAADSQISVAFSASMVVVALLSPLAGAVSDARGRRIPFLAVSTLVCVIATTLLGLGPLWLALTLYAIANLAFQLGLVFYDALLPDVSTAGTVGTVGGTGISIGYVGSFVGLGTGALLLATLDTPHPWIFAATGGLFALFAIPCFVFVREPERSTRPPVSIDRLKQTFYDVRENRSLARFLLARFVYTDAANTLIVFLGIYATQEVGLPEGQSQFVLGAGIAAAIVGGLGFGRWVDQDGAKPVLQRVLGVWVVALVSAALVPLAGIDPIVFYAPAMLAGAALGGTWASDRPLMLELTPEGRVGEFYGLYGMVGRFAAVVGPLVWAGIVDGVPWELVPAIDSGRPVAVLVLALAIVVSAIVLRGVDAPGVDRAAGLDG